MNYDEKAEGLPQRLCDEEQVVARESICNICVFLTDRLQAICSVFGSIPVEFKLAKVEHRISVDGDNGFTFIETYGPFPLMHGGNRFHACTTCFCADEQSWNNLSCV